ncbi:phosphoglycerate kinase, partial [Tetragenococcus halophilus]
MAKKTVEDVDLKGKKVLVRADFNVPVKDGVITDDTRIKAALPTIKYVTQHGGKAILFSHLGRVKTEEDKEGKSLAPVADRLGELLDRNVTFVPETRGEKLEQAIDNLQDGEIVVFENTRFED